jgi:hypothetical protein
VRALYGLVLSGCWIIWNVNAKCTCLGAPEDVSVLHVAENRIPAVELLGHVLHLWVCGVFTFDDLGFRDNVRSQDESMGPFIGRLLHLFDLSGTLTIDVKVTVTTTPIAGVLPKF